VLTLTGLIILSVGLRVFTLRAVAAEGRRLPSGNLSFGKRVGWMDGGWTRKGWDHFNWMPLRLGEMTLAEGFRDW